MHCVFQPFTLHCSWSDILQRMVSLPQLPRSPSPDLHHQRSYKGARDLDQLAHHSSPRRSTTVMWMGLHLPGSGTVIAPGIMAAWAPEITALLMRRATDTGPQAQSHPIRAFFYPSAWGKRMVAGDEGQSSASCSEAQSASPEVSTSAAIPWTPPQRTDGGWRSLRFLGYRCWFIPHQRTYSCIETPASAKDFPNCTHSHWPAIRHFRCIGCDCVYQAAVSQHRCACS